LLYENINRLCKEHGVTRAKLERDTGLYNGAIDKWQKVTPSVERVKAVADYFGVTVDDLLKEDEND